MPANREAVEQLAQRLEEAVSQHNHDPFSVTVNHRLANLAMDAAALLREPQGEPVAWRVQVNLNGVAHFTDDLGVAECRRAEGYHVTPLFAAPAARQPEEDERAKVTLPNCSRCGWNPRERVNCGEINCPLADARQPDSGFTPITQLTEEDRRAFAQERNRQFIGPLTQEAARPSQAQEAIGEVRDSGVYWFDQNPHAFPVGTKFYASPPAAVRELERDRERMDWLDGPNRFIGRREKDWPRSDPCVEKSASFYINGKFTVVEGKTAREAIDAAIRAAVPGEPKEK